MAIPTAMIVLSLTLKAKANRLVNLIAGIVHLAVLAGTFFTGRNPAYYLFYAAGKALLIAGILWQAWRWPRASIVEHVPIE
jgi:hypothetical protein